MKLILMGTNDFVVPIFDDLSKKHDIIAVFTRAPKPMGRKHILTPSPVHAWAENKNLPVHTSIKEFDSIADKPDMIVVISYGVILRDNVLNAAKCINIHPSSLPKYRGPSPIRSAILNGDKNMDVMLVMCICAKISRLMKMIIMKRWNKRYQSLRHKCWTNI